MEEDNNKKTNPAHVLARRLQENRKSLHIARIPDKTKIDFIALAEEEFCGDYGMTLKWLMDDLINPDIKLILERVSELELRLAVVENNPTQDKPKEEESRKMLDGTVKRGLKK